MAKEVPPPGWYPDPEEADPTRVRYWTGEKWEGESRRAEPMDDLVQMNRAILDHVQATRRSVGYILFILAFPILIGFIIALIVGLNGGFN